MLVQNWNTCVLRKIASNNIKDYWLKNNKFWLELKAEFYKRTT
jgi:hypothetical protein